MSRNIEMKDFTEVVNTSLGEVEDTISDSPLYVLLYRVYKHFGTCKDILVRGSYDSMLDLTSDLTSDCDETFKQNLWNFGISFSENTLDSIDTENESRRTLMVLPTWVSIHSLTDKVNSMIAEGLIDSIPTDVFIEDVKENTKYEEINTIVNNSVDYRFTLWYFKSNVSYYADFEEKDAIFKSKFNEPEIYDITSDIKQMLDVQYASKTIVDDLMNYGRNLYDNGIKCVEYSDIFPALEYITKVDYENKVSAFLVYLAETYNMQINTTIDALFSKSYAIYRRSEYCLAEDLFNNQDIYSPIMLYATRQNRRFVYIRDIKYNYTYRYIRLSELDGMINRDESIAMRTWNPEVPNTLVRGNISAKEDLYKSRFVDNMNLVESEYEPEIIPLFSVVSDESKLNEILECFNRYNMNNEQFTDNKYITVRDLLCRKVKDGDDEIIQIGYIYCKDDNSYGNRMSETITISGIQTEGDELIGRSYFQLDRSLNCNLYNINYVYNMGQKSPKALLDLINTTGSWNQEVYDLSLNDDGTRSLLCSTQEKFLYYMMTKNISKSAYDEIMHDLTGDRQEYKVSMYNNVCEINDLLCEFVKYFQLSDLVEAKLFNSYGALNQEYVKYNVSNSKVYLDLDTKLFGVMKIEE